MVASDLGSGEAFRQLTASGADRWSREVTVAGTRHPAGGTRLGAWGAAAVAGAAAALLAACSSATPQQLHIPVTATANAPAANSHTVSMTVGGRTRASLDVLSGTHRPDDRHRQLRPRRAAADRHHARGHPGAAAQRVQPGRHRQRRRPPGRPDRPEHARGHRHPQRRRQLADRPGRGRQPDRRRPEGRPAVRHRLQRRAPTSSPSRCRGRTATCRCRWPAGPATFSSASRPGSRPR